jgi:hypothetical protein
MKKNNSLMPWRIFVFTGITLLFSACIKDTLKQTKTYTIYSAVYKQKSDVLASVNGNATGPVEHAGKIYIKGNYIYLNEVNQGIHIIDNSNPSSPLQIAFLSIPGNCNQGEYFIRRHVQ